MCSYLLPKPPGTEARVVEETGGYNALQRHMSNVRRELAYRSDDLGKDRILVLSGKHCRGRAITP
jgi:hypothetical protein